MPGRSVEKYVVSAIGKVAGKSRVWIAGVFVNKKEAQAWVALLNVARRADDAETITAMDVHAPKLKEGETLTDVKYSGAAIQYSPVVPGLSDDAELA